MRQICKDIFKAVHENKWLSIEYKNKEQTFSTYWIGIKEIKLDKKMLVVDGLRLGQLSLKELTIHIASILSSNVLDGTYYETSPALKEDIARHPEKYQDLFGTIANLKILNYLEMCHKLDTTPYCCDYELLQYLDGDNISGHSLTDEQLSQIVNHFQHKSKRKESSIQIKQLCMNVMSVNTPKGLYVLAYRKLDIDVKKKELRPADEITICIEFTVNGEKLKIAQFLDANDLALTENFEKNQEQIKDIITKNNPRLKGIDDMPYFVALGFNIFVDLQNEYRYISEMYVSKEIPVPIRAFFGELTRRPVRRKQYPIALLNEHINLDQLLAINNAMKYPLTYVQGPPGTGKTNTILIGSNEKVKQALKDIKKLYEATKSLAIYSSALNKNKNAKIEQTVKLTQLLLKYEKILNWKERKESIDALIKGSGKNLFFNMRLQDQLNEVNQQLFDLGTVESEDALTLLETDTAEFEKYLYYTSAKYLKRLNESKNKELLDIIYMKDSEEQLKAFNRFARNHDNLKKLLRIFPIVITTCQSAHKLGEAKPCFDMVIIDEAGQCNTATTLVPILRGENLMLVGDPQQLNPVVLLTESDNKILKDKYQVADEYDYIKNSIYKTFLACDAVSDEILLSHHYRCHEKIIEFNNKKYYNSRLHIKSNVKSESPLTLIDLTESKPDIRNTAPSEAEYVVNFAREHPGKRIGIITPFVNQQKMIQQMLDKHKLYNVICGTVHAFQGDQKDIVLFSLALTNKTSTATYNWLKGNKELINVATSRAMEQLILVSDSEQITRLRSAHEDDEDDLYELFEYVKANGDSMVTSIKVASRALGIKPYSTETEAAFLKSLNHAIGNIMPENAKYSVQKEVSIAHALGLSENITGLDLFFTGRFDFVVYDEKGALLAIELNGKEHYDDATVMERDRNKKGICDRHGLKLISIENTYARRYQYIKDILIEFFNAKPN